MYKFRFLYRSENNQKNNLDFSSQIGYFRTVLPVKPEIVKIFGLKSRTKPAENGPYNSRILKIFLVTHPNLNEFQTWVNFHG